MKNKKGFTLVELIGTFAILAVILTIVAIAWININKSLTKAYYDTLEESVLIAGGEYFANNKGALPKLLGEEQRIDIGHLVRNKYSQDDIKARNGTLCDYENSYVAAYKDSYDRTNYYTCLRCGDYGTDSLACEGNVDYSLNVSAKIKGTTKNYKLTGENWANDDVIITFATLNDIEKAYLTNSSGNALKSCNMTEDSNGIRSCEITVTNSGNYQVYGEGNGKETSRQDASVKIDKTKPTYNVPTNQIIVVENINEGLINALISDIKDHESGIKSIEYSLEKEGSSAKYNNVSIKDSFTVSETKELGKYTLTVRVTNNASLGETKTVSYHIKRKVDIPTNAYCDTSLVYNDTEQTLTKKEGLGYTFTNNKGIDAKNYTVVAKLKDNYTWSLENDTSDKTFVCAIKQKDIYITAKNQEITYGDSIAQGIGQVRVTSGLNISGHELSAVTLKTDNVNVTNNGVIEIVSGSVKIKRNNDNKDVTSNYKFNYTNGNLVIKPRPLKVTPDSNQNKVYGSTDPILKYSYNNNLSSETPKFNGKLSRESGENVGTYIITKGDLKLVDNGTFKASNYSLQFDTKEVTFEIKKANATCPTIGDVTKTYDGTAYTITVGNDAVGGTIKYSENKSSWLDKAPTITNVGNKIIYVKVVGDKNHNDKDCGSGKITINAKEVAVPTTSFCNTLTYNGAEQTLTKTAGEGYTFSENKKTDAGEYTVTATLKSNYVWSGGGTGEKTFKCTISKRNVTITAAEQTVTYGTAITKTVAKVSGNNLVTGHKITAITLTQSTTNVTTTGTITPSGATIKSGTTDVTENYNISYATGKLTIKAKEVTIPTASTYCNTLTYNGAEQTLTKTAGEGYTFSNNKGTNAGEHTVKVTLKSNYVWSGGAIGEKTFKCIISKKTLTPTVTVSNKTYDGTTAVTESVSLTGAVANQLPTATATCTFNDANVGTGKAVSCTIALGSSWTGNYQLSTTSANKTANITAKAITITAKAQEITSGASISNTVNDVEVTGLISGHSLDSITLTQSNSDETITPSNAVIKSGTIVVTNNYNITYNNGTLTIKNSGNCGGEWHKFTGGSWYYYTKRGTSSPPKSEASGTISSGTYCVAVTEIATGKYRFYYVKGGNVYYMYIDCADNVDNAQQYWSICK